MNTLIGGTLTLVLLALAPSAWPDTSRSYGDGDTSRHSSSTATQRRAEYGTRTPGDNPRIIGPGRPRPADQPPNYGFWSAKCIKQRGSSFAPWNHSKDCDHPAYSGGNRHSPYMSPYGYGRPVIIINNYNGTRYRR